MKHGPDIPAICGNECDAFSRKARRLIGYLKHAGAKRFAKRKYQRRSRAIGKRVVVAESRNPWQHHLHPAEMT